MTSINNFATLPFIEALKAFFQELKVPINYIADAPSTAQDILGQHYKPNNEAHQLIEDVYALGMVDDAIFAGNQSFSNINDLKNLKTDYEALLIFGITLKLPHRGVGGLPSRTQLSEITRIFNRAFPYTPVTIVFKYGSYISFANSERVKYVQEWREGEKIGKVSLLRDINFSRVHAGHSRILNELAINRTGKNAINSFADLYKYWQTVLSVSILNKAFYGELQNWYFWAIKEVHFPNPPMRVDFGTDLDFDEALKEHKGKNVIRLLTRILFIWFIKEKGLIPDEIFDEKTITDKILSDFEPQKPVGIFATDQHNSKYYKAILQNLFFATLNQPCQKRAFRTDGQHQNTTQLMRYQSYFKGADYFVALMEKQVPFMNGGLFECLDKPHPTDKGKQGGDRIIYLDGFSDRADNDLLVPDYLFFDADEDVDLSSELGDKHKKSKTRGLMAILKSYKFTITENTPIDEDIALDPELLGKVFENLLASYNPETKTTARKQTGSFYTPREIVDYMVDESLIAYLKNCLNQDSQDLKINRIDEIKNSETKNPKNQINPANPDSDNLEISRINEIKNSETKNPENQINPANPDSDNLKINESKNHENQINHKNHSSDNLDDDLHQLVSYSSLNPFAQDDATQKAIIKALDSCKILDPACGSGAYPMGILQKMVHILHKIDPNNTEWKNRQLRRVDSAIAELELLDDTTIRENTIREMEAQKKDIEEAFANNNLDYGRKLYLIENCIFGVDIQAIATQISKLRFFISLVVDQKVDAAKDNFGIRPLPNLETKFVAANTLIGIERKKKQGDFVGSLFDRTEVQKLEKDLKKVRQRLFSAKTPSTKRDLREQDKALREAMGKLLADEYGDATARLLANWDPYDQNTSSPFFDKEWMFDIREGFDIVIGNPPYVQIKWVSNKAQFNKQDYTVFTNSTDLYCLFYEKGNKLLNRDGIGVYITSNKWLKSEYGSLLRNYLLQNCSPKSLIDFGGFQIFETASVDTNILIWEKLNKSDNEITTCTIGDDFNINQSISSYFKEKSIKSKYVVDEIWAILDGKRIEIKNKIELKFNPFKAHKNLLFYGILTGANGTFIIDEAKRQELINIDKKNGEIIKPILRGQDLEKYYYTFSNVYLINTHNGIKSKNIPSIDIPNEYPNMLSYLNSFGEKFKNRGEKGNNWYNLRSCAYLDRFDAPKIIYADIVQEYGKFYYDENNFLTNDTAFIITGENLRYLTCVLNSKVFSFIYRHFYAGGGLGDKGLRYKKEFLERVPIPQISPESQDPFIDLVEKILAGKKAGENTAAHEAEIDLRVYRLYELTHAEVLLIDPTFGLSEGEYEVLTY